MQTPTPSLHTPARRNTKAAALFNQYGFLGFSISELMKATGLEKRHIDTSTAKYSLPPRRLNMHGERRCTRKCDLRQLVKRKIALKGIKRSVNLREGADVIISSLEGALMMSRLEGDGKALLVIQSYLSCYLDRQRLRA